MEEIEKKKEIGLSPINDPYMLSVFKLNFWDFWLQKIFRNFASMKFQFLTMLYIPTIWGMFHFKPGTKEVWIDPIIGMGFLGGGFVTLSVSRWLANTSLFEKEHSDTNESISRSEVIEHTNAEMGDNYYMPRPTDILRTRRLKDVQN